jgi:hypothetical protein
MEEQIVSVAIMTKVFWAKGLGKTKKAVLLAIADTANDHGFGYLLISTLEKKTDLAPRTIQQMIAEMCDDAGGTVLPVLEKRERRNRSSIFRVHADRLEQHERWSSEKEMSIEELWGAGDAPLNNRGAGDAPGGAGDAPGGAGHRRKLSSDAPRTISEPSREPSLEPYPSLPSEETPPTGELMLVGQALSTEKPSLIEYVKDGWSKLCDDFPRTHRIQVWSDARKKAIARRASEVVRDAAGTVDAYQVWDAMFDAIRSDRWLRGEGEPSHKYPTPFALDIDYILRVSVFARTLEKATVHEADTRDTFDRATGRQFSSTEQAVRNAIERARARKQPRGRE